MSDYGDGCAQFYDEIYGAANRNVVRALGRLAAGGSALELGVGTGRTALALIGQCVRVVGIESSRAMLGLLAAKPKAQQVRAIEGDFSRVLLRERFDLIYVLLNTLFLLEGAQAQLRCLVNVRNMLAANGVFVVEAYQPNPGDKESEDEAGGVSYSRIVLTSQGPRQYSARLYYQDVEELDALAEKAGLGVLERWSNWHGASYKPESSMHVTVYTGAGVPTK